MKFVLKFEKEFSVPLACCELCCTEIVKAETAMVYWQSEDYQNEIHEPLLAHKRCMLARPSLDECYRCSMFDGAFNLPCILAAKCWLSAKAFPSGARGTRAASSARV